jgi:hypothetical protein
MKKIALLILLVIINTVSLCAFGDDSDSAGYFNFSISKELGDGTFINYSFGNGFTFGDDPKYSLGYELLFGEYFINSIGFNIKFGNNDFIINSFYSIMTNFSEDFAFILTVFSFGIGTNISYNISKNVFGIGPQINLDGFTLLILKTKIIFRYNIYMNGNSSPEVEFVIGIWNVWNDLK